MADYLVKLKQAGVSVPLDKDMLTYLLDQAGIPIPSEEALEHSLELSDQLAQTPQTFQMSLDTLKKSKDPVLDELDVVDEVLDILVENGAFDSNQE